MFKGITHAKRKSFLFIIAPADGAQRSRGSFNRVSRAGVKI